MPNFTCRFWLWAVHSRSTLFSNCFQTARKLRIKSDFFCPSLKPSGLIPRLNTCCCKSTSGLHLLCQQMWRCREASQMFVLLGLLWGHQEGERKWSWNSKGHCCTEIMKIAHMLEKKKAPKTFRCDHWKVWQSDKELTRLEFHSDFKKRKINKRKVCQSKTEIIIMFPCLQATTANKFKHKMEEIFTSTNSGESYLTYTGILFWKQTLGFVD